ncbi:MAG TPA: asparagine synthase (glutamine-hydrolyzing) [Blastocatellia bacterium]|nr:asparagine synthase (glutamine-hydrolyzing) [Blastocatellia bacterium]
MCGICGWFLKPTNSRDDGHLIAMADAIQHRGPDDRGYFHDHRQGVAFAHNRLSIIDLSSAGHQPMSSEDGSVVVSYNGELYNYQQLRKELQALGHKFISRSDTEVILRSFIQWGPGSVERFCGMFALAVWSANDRYLFLARDPLGMKPLYYSALPGDQGLVFASEIKAFLALPDFKVQINTKAVKQFLEFGYTFDERVTSLEGVQKLPPGHSMLVIDGVPTQPVPFFKPPTPIVSHDSDLEQDLYTMLSEVVAQHLIADVPVGLLLSGGLDSSVVAAIAARHARITTISMGFADSEVDERPYARLVAEHIGSEHREVTIQPHEVSEGLEEVAWYFDDLFGDWGTVSTRLLYRKCRELGIKVVLVGEGSDELFGGYPVFETALRLQGPMIWRLFQIYRAYAGRRYGTQFGAFVSLMKRYLREADGDLFQAVRLFESRSQLPNNYVMKVDKASMSVSTEARAPFLDRRVAELAYRLPAVQLLADGTNKRILRSMAERFELLPREIFDRPKFGASIAASWMDRSEHFREYASRVILDRDGWVDELGLRDAMTDFFSGRRKGYRFPRAISIFSNVAWRLLLLNLWSRRMMAAR